MGHDWGGTLAMDWAARHPGRVRGIAVTETFLRPMRWAELTELEQARLRLPPPRHPPHAIAMP